MLATEPSADREHGACRRDHRAAGRGAGEDPRPHQLPARAVLLHRGPDPHAAQRPGAQVEVPAVEGAAAANDSALRRERVLQILNPVLGRAPTLRPDFDRARERQGYAGAQAPAPRRQPVAQATRQPRDRLQQEERPGEEAAQQGVDQRATGSVALRSPAAGERPPQDRGEPDGEEGEGDEERRPPDAEDADRPRRYREEEELGSRQQVREGAGRRLVDRLEEAAAPGPIADHSPPLSGRVVDPPGPAGGAGPVVAARPLALEQGLGLAVAVLLLEVAADRVATAVHHHRAGAEAQRPARLL